MRPYPIPARTYTSVLSVPRAMKRIITFSCKYFCFFQFAREGKRNYLTLGEYVTLWRGNRFVGVYQDKKGDGGRRSERLRADNETEIRQGTGKLVGIKKQGKQCSQW